MALARLPEKVYGKFFVLQWDRDSEVFRLYLRESDEENAEINSYVFPDDIPALMVQFKVWGLSEIGNRAIDIAREFGTAQAILSDGRVLPIYNREPKKTKLDWGDELGELPIKSKKMSSPRRPLRTIR